MARKVRGTTSLSFDFTGKVSGSGRMLVLANAPARGETHPELIKRLHLVLKVITLLVLIDTGEVSLSAHGFHADAAASSERSLAVVLVYHRFGPIVTDSMTVTTPVFAGQLKYLQENGYSVVPLGEVVNFVSGHGSLPPKCVAITVDDAHRTVFTDIKPLVERYRVPVTLFVYPSAISNASYAMTWEQLEQLKHTGLFSIESHTYWHPNFRTENKRLSAATYQAFVATQLEKSRKIVQQRFNTNVDMLAWPFGTYDDEVMSAARTAGYVAAFTIDRHNISLDDNVMAIPRYIVTNHDTGKTFASLVSGASAEHVVHRAQAHGRY